MFQPLAFIKYCWPFLHPDPIDSSNPERNAYDIDLQFYSQWTIFVVMQIVGFAVACMYAQVSRKRKRNFLYYMPIQLLSICMTVPIFVGAKYPGIMQILLLVYIAFVQGYFVNTFLVHGRDEHTNNQKVAVQLLLLCSNIGGMIGYSIQFVMTKRNDEFNNDYCYM